MHPILTQRRRLFLYLLVFLQACWVLVELLRRVSPGGGEPVPRFDLFLAVAPLLLVHAFSCLASFYLCRALPLGESRDELVAVAAFGSAALASAGMVAVGFPWITTLVALEAVAPGVRHTYEGGLVVLFVFAAMLYILSLVVHYLFLALEQSRQAETRAFEARILAREAELQALRAQVDPHFLFNSLNSIAGLVGTEPKGARRMCARLAAFLRRTMQLGAEHRIALDDELALAEDYLSVEKVRFGDRLDVRREIDEETRRLRVPPLVLQPLVENSVRHGIAQLVEGGHVRLRAERRGERLRLEVRNDCDAERRAKPGGVGLDNVARRLRAAWGDEARLEVQDSGDEYSVRLTMPVEQPGQAEDMEEPT
ncbi:MAG: histidine kinase [Thermoanaerobaculia bacterium]|nr:histidine kinase [Thermoanaerobaculia bacterium]